MRGAISGKNQSIYGYKRQNRNEQEILEMRCNYMCETAWKATKKNIKKLQRDSFIQLQTIQWKIRYEKLLRTVVKIREKVIKHRVAHTPVPSD